MSHRLPAGVVGLVKICDRHIRTRAAEDHHLRASRAATLLWACYAVASAQCVRRMGSLIEAVIFACWCVTNFASLPYNDLGCLAVVGTGLAITAFDRTP